MLNQPFIQFVSADMVMHRGIIEHDDGQRHPLLAPSNAANQIGDVNAFDGLAMQVIPEAAGGKLQGADEGLVRQNLPKDTVLSGYTQQQLDAIADEINARPRKSLGARYPLAVYRGLLLNESQYSTLIH